MNAIEIKNLTKKYDNFSLGPIDLGIPSGVIIGLIGENGAGKTTLLKSILNIIQIDDGKININGNDYTKNNVKDDVGVVLDNSFFPEIMTIKDVDLVMKNIYEKWDTKYYFSLVNKFSLNPKMNLKTMSKGMHKKVEIITALAHHPKLLILDEPTSGLDPIVRNEILDLFLNFIEDDEHTIILSSHITSDLDHIADYIIFINEGKVVLTEEKDSILNNYRIIRCSEEQLKEIDSADIICSKKNKYNYDILIKDCINKYRKMTMDKPNIEDIMLLFIKGEVK